jgi:cytochrome b6-f complex iron-sulfur subunit
MADYPEGVNYVSEKRIFVVREQNRVRVVSGVCTHLGCTVQWIEERNHWECPCHGSIFSNKGEATKGPARNPLPWYDVSITPEGALVVNENQIVPYAKTLSVNI